MNIRGKESHGEEEGAKRKGKRDKKRPAAQARRFKGTKKKKRQLIKGHKTSAGNKGLRQSEQTFASWAVA